MSRIVKYRIPCEVCGSEDAKVQYNDASSFCFACEKFFPPVQQKLIESVQLPLKVDNEGKVMKKTVLKFSDTLRVLEWLKGNKDRLALLNMDQVLVKLKEELGINASESNVRRIAREIDVTFKMRPRPPRPHGTKRALNDRTRIVAKELCTLMEHLGYPVSEELAAVRRGASSAEFKNK